MSLVAFRQPLLVAAMLLVPSLAAARGHVAVQVSFDPQSAGELSASERVQLTSHAIEALRRWTAPLLLRQSRTIELQIGVDLEIVDVAGYSVETVYVDEAGPRLIYEQGLAHELRTGFDPNGSAPDLRIDVNSEWMSSTASFQLNPVARDQAVAGDKIDAMSALLHAVGHAIAYAGWADGAGQPPADYASSFDRFVVGGSPSLFTGEYTQQYWGDSVPLTTGSVHHWGNLAGLRRMDAARGCVTPRPAAKGGNTPEMLLEELMNGVGFEPGRMYHVSGLDHAVMTDLGLPVDAELLFGTSFEGQ